ncbi:hypothetical protein [Croceimicrobium hydrocarbonivorans]|uniref:Uncharacterized protein n=1 Tax=Croceimicrobium hydrocarbonivorans TaxID=2761580 RepID=A0A7H0VDR1_9FLAO|nr:hypothetical protein [Croceimicrobium hydrocarbonivorans]QNR23859.1 hypothetical protein H4K34_16005 [Croceimicrobium hydrocarbonivorans]
MKLIPVLELSYYNEDIAMPEEGPYWKYPKEWDEYHLKCLKSAGFSESLQAIEAGSSFFALAELSDADLKKIVLDYTEDYRKGLENRDEIVPFYGGYILELGARKLLYPQCCSDLGDIQYWKDLSMSKISFENGHPQPKLRFEKEWLYFDLNMEDSSEDFCPCPTERSFKLSIDELRLAIQSTEIILENFEQRIKALFEREYLEMLGIEELLIWRKSNKSYDLSEPYKQYNGD